MKAYNLTLALALLLVPTLLRAQDDELRDSVLVMGTVRNFNQWTPMQGCTVLLTSGTDTVATTFSAADGTFAFDPLPAGAYTLHVSREFSFYRADLLLATNAELSIAVDTIRQVMLQPVQISERKRSEDSQLITHVDDYRLWNLSGRMEGRRSADVADPVFAPFTVITHFGKNHAPVVFPLHWRLVMAYRYGSQKK